MKIYHYFHLFFSILSINTNYILVNGLNQLSFSGGGAFGAVEIGILEKLRYIEPDKDYDFYTGISAGGINSGYLSHFDNIDEGIQSAKLFYTTIKNKQIYSIIPKTNVSILNTKPLEYTIYSILSKLSKPIKETYIGTTNLYTGKLDIFRYDTLKSLDDLTILLMCTSAIPVVFPPITFQKAQYADGGTLQNELLNIKHDNSYLNITFITSFSDDFYNDKSINTIKDMVMRTIQVIKNSYNNEYNKINTNCDTPIGEINKYFVNSSLLKDYNMLNFNNGKELIEIGYHNVETIKTYLC